MVQTIEDAYQAASTIGNSLLLLDRYFLTVPALEKLKELNGSNSVRMEIVTKAKNPALPMKNPFSVVRKRTPVTSWSSVIHYAVPVIGTITSVPALNRNTAAIFKRLLMSAMVVICPGINAPSIRNMITMPKPHTESTRNCFPSPASAST